MRSIRARLLVPLLAGLAVVLVAGGAAVHVVARQGLTRQLDADAETRARTLASLVAYEPPRLVLDTEDAMRIMGETPWELRTMNGEVLRRFGPIDGGRLPSRPLADGDVAFDDVVIDGAPHRAVRVAFLPRVDLEEMGDDEDEDEGRVVTAPEVIVAVVALDAAPRDRALATLGSALLAAGAGVAVTVVVLVVAGIRWGLAPLARLGRQLGSVGAETISRRVDGGAAPRELQPVYRELNAMLDRVQQTVQRERSFADAAAHELRTPLAELRTTAEVAARWPDADRAAAALQDVLAIGGELERLVESLLLISRGNAIHANGAPPRAPLRPIVDDAVARQRTTIEQRRLRVGIDVDASAALPAPREALQIIVRNLVDNAVWYTPADGALAICWTRDTGDLVVANGPVALAAGDVDRLFEPFWRTDSARSDRGHVGLGLTVVERVAVATGLRVKADLAGDRLEVRLGHGTRVAVEARSR